MFSLFPCFLIVLGSTFRVECSSRKRNEHDISVEVNKTFIIREIHGKVKMSVFLLSVDSVYKTIFHFVSSFIFVSIYPN